MSGLLGAPWALWLAVAVGSALGGMARFAVGLLATRHAAPGWPWGTFTVNVLGSLVIGLLAGWWVGRGQPPLPRALLMVGVMGGFTTYSTFALETVHRLGAAAMVNCRKRRKFASHPPDSATGALPGGQLCGAQSSALQ